MPFSLRCPASPMQGCAGSHAAFAHLSSSRRWSRPMSLRAVRISPASALQGSGIDPHVVQLAGCKPHWMAGGRKGGRRGRRCRHRHQHGLSREARDRRLCRFRAHARPGSRASPDRRDRRRHLAAGDGEDAVGLGRQEPERPGTRPPRTGGRREAGHGPRQDAMPVLDKGSADGRPFARSRRPSPYP